MSCVLESPMSAERPRGRLPPLSVAGAALVAAMFAIAHPAAADTVTVVLDQARLMRVPERTATIVIGNPAIADVSLQNGGVLVVTGKGYGSTNYLALDRAGKVLAEHELLVKAPAENIVSVYYGVDRATLSCEPQCQPRVMLGDAPKIFDAAAQQSANRNGAAGQGGGGVSSGR